ncbi:MAG: ATP-dependent DNA helicase RecG [Betaproteobacteria bacterium]|nr:ATP-dependent DNA helicase RecG [Betaproteobacteria bacterium]
MAPANPGHDLTPLHWVAESVREKLERMGIHTEQDLLLHLPLRYEDETQLHGLSDAPVGVAVQVEGVVVGQKIQPRPRRMLLCTLEVDGEPLQLRFFHFYPSQIKQLATGNRLRVMGEVRRGFFGAEMAHPRYRIVRQGEALPAGLTPVYPTTAGLSQRILRQLIERAWDDVDVSDTLPPNLADDLGLPPLESSLRLLHSPDPKVPAMALATRTHPAWRRIKFEELLALQISMRKHRQRRQRARAQPLASNELLGARLLENLPFQLTVAQQGALGEIRADLAKPHPMQRILQGDVGSGKTIVAALAALQAIESGAQVAVMAPTEILAEQNFNKFRGWLSKLGLEVIWLAGTQGKKQRREVLARVASGEAHVAVGTHALFQEQVEFSRLGLCIVDEQHRFGVQQRLALRRKGTDGVSQPHQLMMSATPIPRTLAMSFYADLDVSVIGELPPGRTPIVTKLLADTRREEVEHRIRDACVQGGQAYWVCPLIEESEALQLKTALETFERIQTTFPELRVGLVHGRLKGEEKAAVMEAFKQGAIQLLVATTVIEVGVDVPNASMMVIEHAERMGLAQLHQLRGRVGRGTRASVCVLLYQQPLGGLARERLRIIFENTDGFEIAREDLRLRGPGELLGARQSGMPMLRFADLNTDADLLEAAREAAASMLKEHPDLARAHLQRWLGGRQDYLRV